MIPNGFVDRQSGNLGIVFHLVLVDSNDYLLAAFDRLLILVSGVLNFPLGKSFSIAATIPAHRVDFSEVVSRGVFHFLRERFDKVRPTEWIDGIRHAGFFRDDLLGAQRDQCRLVGRQCQRLIVSISMQTLCAAENTGQRLNRNPNDVVERLLHGQRNSRGLRVETKLQ